MAGYHGYSMSNNAVAAYKSGEMPISKWTKATLIKNISKKEFSFNVDLFAKLTRDEIIDRFLEHSSWHHTSKEYNRTDFYSLNIKKLNKLTDDGINAIIVNRKKRCKIESVKDNTRRTATVKYSVLDGHHRQRRKYRAITETIEIDGTWAYTSNGKKRLSGKHIEWKVV